jgi:hypothetical protein
MEQQGRHEALGSHASDYEDYYSLGSDSTYSVVINHNFGRTHCLQAYILL